MDVERPRTKATAYESLTPAQLEQLKTGAASSELCTNVCMRYVAFNRFVQGLPTASFCARRPWVDVCACVCGRRVLLLLPDFRVGVELGVKMKVLSEAFIAAACSDGVDMPALSAPVYHRPPVWPVPAVPPELPSRPPQGFVPHAPTQLPADRVKLRLDQVRTRVGSWL